MKAIHIDGADLLAMFQGQLPRLSALKLCGAGLIALGLAACETAPEPIVEPAPAPVVYVEPEPEPVVEIFEPEPVPSIDIDEYERQQAELSRATSERLRALRLAEEAARPAIVAEPEPVVEATPLTLTQKLAAASDPRGRISILKGEGNSSEVRGLMKTALTDAVTADKASGNTSGAAEMLVTLGEMTAKDGGGKLDSDIRALELYAEAQALDSSNSVAPTRINSLRAKLQGHADTLHEQAVAYFAKQDFAPAVSRWKTVLLIDPGNTAARDWYAQSRAAIGR